MKNNFHVFYFHFLFGAFEMLKIHLTRFILNVIVEWDLSSGIIIELLCHALPFYLPKREKTQPTREMMASKEQLDANAWNGQNKGFHWYCAHLHKKKNGCEDEARCFVWLSIERCREFSSSSKLCVVSVFFCTPNAFVDQRWKQTFQLCVHIIDSVLCSTPFLGWAMYGA